MQMRWNETSGRRERRRPAVPGLFTAAAAVAAVTLLVSGCGGSKAPQVASLGSGSTTTTSSSTTPTPTPGGDSAPGGGSGQGGHYQVRMNVGNPQQGREFSACMRKHGIANFPDPNGQGVIQFGSDNGIDPSSPAFQSAQSACRKLLPNGGQPSPQQQAQMKAALLKFSQCMRAHGIKDFPDPTNNGIRIRGGPGSDLNPSNPQFQAAQQACQADLPGKVGQKFGAGPAPAGGGKPGSGGGGG